MDAYTPSGMKSTNVTRVSHLVSLQDRCLRQGHLGGVLWFTGLPASGKKTIAFQLERRLFEAGYEVFAFDSTWQRKGLSSDLGFSREDRRENIRRAGELAAIMARSGIIAISAFVSPYSGDRAAARATVGENFHEIFMNVPLDVCMSRDTQDRYVRASHGEFLDFTGVTAPYESPVKPEVTLSAEQSVDESIDRLTDYVNAHFRNI